MTTVREIRRERRHRAERDGAAHRRGPGRRSGQRADRRAGRPAGQADRLRLVEPAADRRAGRRSGCSRSAWSQKLPCYDHGWFFGANDQYTHACYSDIPHLFYARGFADDLVPYFDHIPAAVSGDMEYLEYPVLTGLFMEVASWVTPHGADLVHREQVYWLVNAGMLLVCAVVTVVAVARTHRRRPWDALLVALAPAFALTATINWDLLAVALTAVGMLLWARGRPVAAGVLIGLATAAKLYPVLLLGPAARAVLARRADGGPSGRALAAPRSPGWS